MTVVKVCGITRLEDARAAVAAGAGAIGFLFWPRSPRAVGIEQARAIVRSLPALVAPVGVFVDQPPGEVARTAARVGLSALQLHGGERVEDYADLGLRIIKSVAVGPDRAEEVALSLPSEVTVLLDAHDPVRRGGTGRTIDWGVASRVAAARAVILSGGLRPENVGAAIAAVRPYAVDVSSGVEMAPGRKDVVRMRSFLEAVAQVV